MDIIERAARAICIAQLNVPDEFSEMELMPLWKVYVPEARAAIEALREPDEGMIEAASMAWMNRDLNDPKSSPIRDSWQAMIDQALKG